MAIVRCAENFSTVSVHRFSIAFRCAGTKTTTTAASLLTYAISAGYYEKYNYFVEMSDIDGDDNGHNLLNEIMWCEI